MSQKEIITFHNCENFFYPTNDTLTNDDEFTSSSKRNWDFDKFHKKKKDLAETYIRLSNGKFPAIIGLCEIENKDVLRALCHDSPLKDGGYDFIHYDSKDVRGIDVAFLYRKDIFKVTYHENIRVDDSLIKDEPTRDILFVKGELKNTPLNIFILHAPSKRNKNKNKDLRKTIFDMVYQRVEELYSDGEKNIIVMGDFNDNPWNKTILEGFKIKRHFHPFPILHNLMMKNKDKAGSYIFNNEEHSFDQFMVSYETLRLVNTNEDMTHIFKDDYIIDQNANKSISVPFSTYKRFKYQGGISDHFPIYLEIDTSNSNDLQRDN